MKIITYPIGTKHTMSREWLNEHGIIFCKNDAPSHIVDLCNMVKSMGIIGKKHAEELYDKNGQHLYYATSLGAYDFRTTIKITDDCEVRYINED